jgi:hypothetical protein
LRVFSGITAGEEAQILAFLNSGKRVFLMGENTAGVFAAKNNAIISLVAAAGGVAIAFGNPNNSLQNINPPWNVVANTVTYAGAGAYDNPGNGLFITDNGTAVGFPGTAIAFGRGTMTNAPTGTLAIVCDVNFLQPGQHTPGNGNEELTDALVAYVSGVIVEDPPVAPEEPVVPEPGVTPGVDFGAGDFSGGGCFPNSLTE